MKIKNVTIKNIRGFENKTIHLDMLPNHPSILVAPNGTGKSSFAIAFKSLKPKSFQVDRDEIYSNNDTFIPELILETETETLTANPNKNDISKEFAVYVINNQNKAKAITRNINGNHTSSAKMQVAPIVLISNIPSDTNLNNTFTSDYNLKSLPQGTVPSIGDILKNKQFIAKLDMTNIKPSIKQQKPIDNFVARLGTYTGKKIDIWNKIENEDILLLANITEIHNLVNYYKEHIKTTEPEASIYLKIIQLIKLYLKDKKLFNAKISYAKYLLERDSYKSLFSSLKDTWKSIHPKEVGKNFIIEIPDTDKLSNGERDIIVFLAMLQQARNALTKQNNILIIDEIFDYLDDANLIAAQYYITELIKEIKDKKCNIFPVILSHLNPGYFKSYAFKDMKVYYLNPHVPMDSDKMHKLLLRRNELMEADKKNKTETDLISKYMLHFHDDYSQDMTESFGGKSELMPWRKIPVFKEYCKTETTKYLNQENYDSVAVCVWLRECIEKYLYHNLPEENRSEFLETHGTKNKIDFAEKHGVDYLETFSLLGLIYNENLHIIDKKSNVDCRETLYSRLENNTIREMIKKTIDYCNRAENV